jgi:hypothetical protein
MSRDLEWPNPERASPAAPCAPFLPRMLQAYMFSSVFGILYACCKCFMWMLHMLQWLYTYVANVCSKCFSCFRRMLHGIYLGVAYVSHLYCESRCCIYTFSHICYKCFHLDVAYVLQWVQTCFPRVLDVCCKCFNCFGRMLQMFPLDIA